eukprot:s1402_g6.t1
MLCDLTGGSTCGDGRTRESSGCCLAAANTDSAGTRDGIACEVITLDYRLSMEAGCFEWAVLVSLWLGSVWFAYCFCGCRYSNFCYCQIWTCAVLVLLAMASVTSLMKTS